MTIILETKRLTKCFGGLAAVNNFDFEIREGEILGLIGPNGAGKTTVFNLISGFLPVTRGIVNFLGRDITRLPPYLISDVGMSRLFQQGLTFHGMTVLDNVLAGFHKSHQAGLVSSVFRTRAARAEEARLCEKAMSLLEILGIPSLWDREPASLPHGHQMTLGLAIALASAPKLLLLDEPATGMNPSESDQMMEHIREIRARGVTIVVVEHDMRVIRSLCDRLICMNFGEKLCEGDPDHVTSHPDVCAAYLGKGRFNVADD
jgi:branched-chain amino acid transport system ATP-binding protein